MTIVGITGHSKLNAMTEQLVHHELDKLLLDIADDDLVGVTCLARGADQIFADVVLAHHGQLEVIAPSEDYFEAIRDPRSRARCDYFLSRAASVRTLPYAEASSEAYLAASKALVDRCGILVAVWDGGQSGTADAVDYAKSTGRNVAVVWPAGASRG